MSNRAQKVKVAVIQASSVIMDRDATTKRRLASYIKLLKKEQRLLYFLKLLFPLILEAYLSVQRLGAVRLKGGRIGIDTGAIL